MQAAHSKAMAKIIHRWVPPNRSRRFLAGVFSQRLRPVWLLAGLGWFLFGAFRAGLLIHTKDLLANVKASEIAHCFTTGLRYDAIPIGYALLPMVLLLSLAPATTFRRKWFRRLIVGYGAAVTSLALLTEVVGAAFFLHFNARLNAVAMDYFGHFREVAIYLWNAYPIWLLAVGILLVPCGCYLAFRWVFWRGGRPRCSPLGRVGLAVVLTGLCLLSLRGGVEPQPRGSGSAYFSQNNVVNQISLNNIYTFAQAAWLQWEDNEAEQELYPLPSPDEAFATAQAMLLQDGDKPAGGQANPLWRMSRTNRPRQELNVVVIVMEGMAGSPVGALGHTPSHTPNFDALCRQGLFFDRMYAVGQRTSQGLVGVLCGFPDLNGQSVLKRLRSQGVFLTLPQQFANRGYHTIMLYGGDTKFDNMRAFFGAGGIREFVDQPKILAEPIQPQELPPGNWGLPDEVIFRHADQKFRQLDQDDQPFFAVILTVSNHEPYDVPLDRTTMLPHDTEARRCLNAYRYADWSLGEFFRQARQAEYFRRTLFVLVADHGRDRDLTQILDAPGHRVPCLFYNPDLLRSETVSTVCSQTDLAPTLLGWLGGDVEHGFLGRNVLAIPPDDGFALLHEGQRLAWIRGNRAMIQPPYTTPKLYTTDRLHMQSMPEDRLDPAALQALQKQMLSYYQAARVLYLTRRYRRGVVVQQVRAASQR